MNTDVIVGIALIAVGVGGLSYLLHEETMHTPFEKINEERVRKGLRKLTLTEYHEGVKAHPESEPNRRGGIDLTDFLVMYWLISAVETDGETVQDQGHTIMSASDRPNDAITERTDDEGQKHDDDQHDHNGGDGSSDVGGSSDSGTDSGSGNAD